ncbi:MAG: hypothetical protein COV59_04025 [Candidatus Magasanikbacteria bacterium CG11_big_fil_rev_8_21_14_0_20_39_34]|uniref:O-antigen ligase-related domain-containing protein n=1 Tax=Candidatus Magasanikbacteria bacterium CG11_big_fil_rev_8_21_14_0_20_39_34 TaxID=1974653 RepID=A0A2H0N4J0_9BACT|nr:MAG: hypothetical protein COV59_04025 [Candidatus Magasanikbacteria bacterium CG11_big_fil_rev_8_21_14_0_20_39_34]
MFSIPSKKVFKSFLVFLSLVGFAIIVNPWTNIDILLLLITALVASYIFLQEKLLLVFLIIRPTLDHWRDYPLITYQGTVINLNSTLSILLLIWCIFIVLRYRVRLKNHLFLLSAFFLSLLTLLSSLYSVDPFTSLIESLKLYNIFFLFIAGYILIKAEKISLQEIFFTTILSAIVPILTGLYQLITGTGLTTDDIHGRILGTLAHPNVFAFLVLWLLFFYVQFTHITKKYLSSKKIQNIIGGFLFLLLLFTYTRAALLGFLIFLGCIGLIKYRKIFFISTGTLILLYGLFFPINALIRNTTSYDLQNISVISRLTARSEDADSISWRSSVTRESIPIGLKKPFFGYGYGTFPVVWENFRGDEHLWDSGVEAHDDYLRLFVEVGSIGLFLYLMFIVSFIFFVGKNITKEPKEKYLLFGWVITFALLSLSDNMLHHTPVMWPMWTLWGAMVANYYKEKLFDWSPENVLESK